MPRIHRHPPSGARDCGLTLPSKGQAQAGFAHMRLPLMSNVESLLPVVVRRPRWGETGRWTG